MKLIVGLGNPGKEYNNTRHNIGFEFIDYYLEKNNINESWSKKFDGLYIQTTIGREKVIFLKPQTYMNLSGNSVSKVCHYFNIDISDILIICDDLESAKIIEGRTRQYSKLYLRIPTFDEQILGKINSVLGSKGAEVIIYCEDTKQRFKSAKFADFKENGEKWQKLCDFLGEKNVKAVE